MIVCIGAFDGYHIGHLSLFEKAREMSIAKNTDWRIITFHPHPRSVLGGTHNLLFTGDDKALLRSLLNIPEPIRIPFSLEFAATAPSEFLAQVREKMNVEGIVVGENFRFGKNRTGDGEFLREYCSRTGIDLALMPSKITPDGETISSTRIREMVRTGCVDHAAALLSYTYFIRSEVEHGQKRGHSLGYPTANIAPGVKKLIPAEGVYAAAMFVEGTVYPAAVSVGTNPTFGELETPRIEAHAIGFSGDLYSQRPVVAFLKYIRPMKKFGGESELSAQLKCDCEQTVEIYGRSGKQLEAFSSLVK